MQIYHDAVADDYGFPRANSISSRIIVFLRTNIVTCACMYVYVCMYVYLYTYMYVYICAYIYMFDI